MKIFRHDSVPNNNVKVKEGSIKKATQASKKPHLSKSEIREKLAAHVETSDSAKELAMKNSQRLGEGFLNSGSDEIKSDIAKNDPHDTNTQEKLKSVLSKGAFNFSPQERENLERILGQSS